MRSVGSWLFAAATVAVFGEEAEKKEDKEPAAEVEVENVNLKFLADIEQQPGVVKLESGLMYKVLREAPPDSKYSPTKDSPCECHYAGTTPALTPNAVDIDESEWQEFDSSYKRGSPTSFAPNQVIKGWTEAMQLMKQGEKWEMYIPSDLGYGAGGSGDKLGQSAQLRTFQRFIVKRGI